MRSGFLIGVLLIGFAGREARADGPDAQAMRDVLRTVQARRLFLEDPKLAQLNLGVIVKGQLATLWGPIPSLEIGLRAEQRIRTMIEVVEIRNLFHVVEDVGSPAIPSNLPQLPPKLPDRLPPVLPRDLEPQPPPALPRPLIGPGADVALAGKVQHEPVANHVLAPAYWQISARDDLSVRLPLWGTLHFAYKK